MHGKITVKVVPFPTVLSISDSGVMHDCGMLYDGQAKAGPANRLGTAFVHPLKTFKDPLLFRLRDTDPRIADRNQDGFGGGFYAD